MPARARVLLAGALVALALALAACGDDEGEITTGPAPTESPSGGAPPSLSGLPPEFRECLAEQGIDLESVTDVSAVIHSPEGERCFDELHGG